MTDKMLDNFRFIGLIHLALPNARIIHACRDPVDTCLSCFAQFFSEKVKFAWDLGELGRYYHAYEKLMAHWRSVLPEGSFLEVRYEAVVDNLEREVRRILTYCDLPWDDACLDFHRANSAVRTASVVQVRQPIYRSSVDKWRPDEEILRPLLDGLAGKSGPVTSALA
jgi:hypothetical protein